MKTSRPKQKRPTPQRKPSSLVVEVITDLDLNRVSGSDASGPAESGGSGSGSFGGVDGSGGGSGSGSGSSI